ALQPGIRSCPRQSSGRQNAIPAAVLAASWSWASPMNSRYGVRRVTALTFRRGMCEATDLREAGAAVKGLSREPLLGAAVARRAIRSRNGSHTPVRFGG